MSIQDQVFAALANDLSALIYEFWACSYSEKCESEIERALAATFLLGAEIRGKHKVGASRIHAAADKVHLFLEPQAEIGNYRVDFLLGASQHAGDLLKCVAIECDGHDWHERTKEQAARDKSRDRYLSSQVGRVLRFTGSEIYRSPDQCCVEALKILHLVTLGSFPSDPE